ncbi:MAG TPA: alpha/beta hydrolase [Acidimicrobiales bacterium]|nr:alpha/beta hydrolase [Acidimicrobiales bacterium]
MPHLDRDGVKIHYESHGDGPVVLLSHGYTATTEMWRGQIAPLTSAGYRVVVWDMRGHGASDSPEDDALYSEAATMADMAAVLDAVEADRAVIGGLSLGGYMSLAFNIAHPDRVRALMLFDTGPGFRKDEARDGWNANAIRTGEKLGDGLARAARGMLVQHDARVIDSLPTIPVPTLVLIGENDTPFVAGTDYMAAKIPTATKVVIADAGHAANIDQPAAFNDAVLAFLGGLG